MSMNLNIGVIKGDGIGPEIVTEAMKVLDKAAEKYGHACKYTQLLLGGASIDVHGIPLTDETVEPVSYTHLDVYKRQMYQRLDGTSMEAGASGSAVLTADAIITMPT